MTGSELLAIDCRHLVHRYGHFTAVDDLSLQVEAGETMGCSSPTARARQPLFVC